MFKLSNISLTKLVSFFSYRVYTNLSKKEKQLSAKPMKGKRNCEILEETKIPR